MIYLLLFCISLFFSSVTQAQISGKHTNIDPHASMLHKIAIIGKDNRDSIPDKYKDVANGIGIIFPDDRFTGNACSAFCVADNVIATNAHCLVKNISTGRKRSKSANLDNVLFSFPEIENRSFGTRSHYYINFRKTMAPLQYVLSNNPDLSIYSGQYSGSNSFHTQRHDWAFAKLVTPICKNRNLKFADISIKKLRAASLRNRVFMIGYHGDDEMAFQRISKNCRINSFSNKKPLPYYMRRKFGRKTALFSHTCDGVQGSSGSPVFYVTDKGPRVIGINRGSVKYSRYRALRDSYTGRIFRRRRLASLEINIAVHPNIFLKGLDRFINEDLLDNLDEFKEIQSLLKKLHLYKSKVDGVWGAGSRNAILRYERKKKLTRLGFPTGQLLSLLRSDFGLPAIKKQENKPVSDLPKEEKPEKNIKETASASEKAGPKIPLKKKEMYFGFELEGMVPKKRGVTLDYDNLKNPSNSETETDKSKKPSENNNETEGGINWNELTEKLDGLGY